MILLHSASQIATPKSDGSFAVIPDGAIAAEKDRIVFVGTSAEGLASYPQAEKMDVSGKVLIPGFVDAHTHAIFGGDRCNEFLMRLRGATYQQIAASGGGIQSTMKATRAASAEQLLSSTEIHLQKMLEYGTTTVEIKSGYGLTPDSERKLLDVANRLSPRAAQDIVVTFLGAHDFPPEESREAYVNRILNEMLPAVATSRSAAFCDVFCDEGYYSIAQSRAISQRAKELGLKIKLHVDELADVNGAALAAELGAVSADHLICANEEGIRKMADAGVVAVLLPGTSIGLKSGRHAPAQKMLELGVKVAVATDFNPGTCFCHSMQFILQLSVFLYRLSAEQAITAATLNGAAALSLQDRVGSLEPGKQMDCLVFDIPHYGYLLYNLGVNRLETVFKRGTLAWSKRKTI